ncbi:hypothetical protein E2C01_074245 [Portunus trituberculatus]|uniref:Uncharacterized protein n=1 Tax=Portunus trituberculatus TaxID=210409 RepID=A0A5B7IGL2_PORTR|nr:hypothetical protein [Portunus trituberculatus]
MTTHWAKLRDHGPGNPSGAWPKDKGYTGRVRSHSLPRASQISGPGRERYETPLNWGAVTTAVRAPLPQHCAVEEMA